MLLYFLVCFLTAVHCSKIADTCLKCICQASTGCSASIQCITVRNRTFCGPYQISYNFWLDAGRPGNHFEACTTSESCSEITVAAYMEKYATDCNKDGVIDCLDYAIIHKLGPRCGQYHWLESTDYWVSFKETSCYPEGHTIKKPLMSYNSPSSLTLAKYPQKDVVQENCLKCICEASTYCKRNYGCANGFCGSYLISKNYWIDGGRIGKDHVSCSLNKTCAENTIQAYMRKYYKDCNGDGFIDCEDFGAIHQLGPSCSASSLYATEYWKHFEYCNLMAPSARRELAAISYYPGVLLTPEDFYTRSTTSPPKKKKVKYPPFKVNTKFIARRKTVRQPTTNQLVEVNAACLECICEASSGCVTNSSSCQRENGCGLYQISEDYWHASGRPRYKGDKIDYYKCAQDRHCSEEAVRGYMSNHGRDCNNDGVINCVDFALIHAQGPASCAQKNVFDTQYWSRFESCHGFA